MNENKNLIDIKQNPLDLFNKWYEEAKLKAEEVLSKIKAGKDFIELAKEYSEDKASYKDGGVLYAPPAR